MAHKQQLPLTIRARRGNTWTLHASARTYIGALIVNNVHNVPTPLITKWLPPWRKGRITCLWIKLVFWLSDDWYYPWNHGRRNDLSLDFFNNNSKHRRMCVMSTLCGNVDKHSPFVKMAALGLNCGPLIFNMLIMLFSVSNRMKLGINTWFITRWQCVNS